MFCKPLARLRYLHLYLLRVVKIPHCPFKRKAVFFFSGVLLPPLGLCLLQNQGRPGLFWLTYITFSVGLSICLHSCLFLWRVVLPCKVPFLAYVAFVMFCFWLYVLSKLVSIACVTFKLPFYRVCRFQTRFYGVYYSPFNFHSVCFGVELFSW